MRRSGPDHLWHAIPLAYVLRLLETRELRSSRRLPPGISPGRSIQRRRRLGLDDVVHLSLASTTPLLECRTRSGVPHALLRFDPCTLDRHGVALLRGNTKRWTHREALSPVTGEAEKGALLAAWRDGRYPSLEVLVPERLPLDRADALVVSQQDEAVWLNEAVIALGLAAPPILVDRAVFPVCEASDRGELALYRARCLAMGCVLDPPEVL